MWRSDEPKQLMSEYAMRIVKDKGSEWNKHSQWENRWEQAECAIIGEYCLQVLVFSRHDCKIPDSYTVGAITNLFYDLLQPFEAKSDLEKKKSQLQDGLKGLFG